MFAVSAPYEFLFEDNCRYSYRIIFYLDIKLSVNLNPHTARLPNPGSVRTAKLRVCEGLLAALAPIVVCSIYT